MQMKTVTLDECKEIWDDYQKLKQQKKTIETRLAFAKQFLEEAKSQIYYAEMQIIKLEEKING